MWAVNQPEEHLELNRSLWDRLAEVHSSAGKG
jgi:hypothetical protein